MKKDSSIITVEDLKKLWSIIKKNWWIPLIFSFFASILAYLYVHKQTEIFSASTQLLLKSNDQYIPSSVINETYNSYYGSAQTYIDNSNEMRVIKSFNLIEKTIDRLDFDVSYYIVGRLKTQEQFKGMPFKVTYSALNNELFEQQMKFKILNLNEFEITYKKGQTESKIKGVFDKELIGNDIKAVVYKTGTINPQTISELTKVEYLIQIHYRPNLIAYYQSALNVENPEYTNILQLSVSDVIPERAITFLDTLSQVYIENTLLSRIEINEKTLYYIEKQMDEVTGVLNEIEDTMQAYKEDKAILDLSREGEEYFRKLSDYDAKKTDFKLQIGALDDLEKYIIEDRDPQFLPPSVYITSGDGFLIKSTSELYNLQISRNDALTGVTPESFAIQELDKKIEALKKTLLTYIANARKATLERIENVNKEIAGYIGKIQTLPLKQRGLINIQRRLSVNENMYIFLLQKRANTIIAKAGIIPETKVIETARNVGLISPNKNKIYYSFVGFALLFSLLLIVIRVIFYQRVESFEELKAATHLPIMGEVPFVKNIHDLILVVDSEPKSAIAESFRSIRTNLQYMSIESGSKVVVTTSNNSGEGKTFCTLNLACILAKASKRVLILELDLHKPRVQKGLELEADRGISTIVIGKDSIEECIKKTQIENLEVILSGPLPPNPSEMILSKQLAEIIEYGRKNYDYVFVDTPPVGLISDALMLMKYADITLFVINTKFAYKAAINNAHEIVEFNKIRNFGFLLNGVKRRKSRYYYNRYGYGYGYGSGYGGYGYGGYGGYGGTN
ncbi:MAG: polysaccharide biosynthesis tyrosine autokinase [Bacteroidota bacterium]